MVQKGVAILDVAGSSRTMRSKWVPKVVQFIPVPLQPLAGVYYWRLLRAFPASVVLGSFVRDEMSLRFNNLEDQESELLCPPNSVEPQDLFFRWHFLLHPKFLHVAHREQEDATFDSLHVARCCSWVILWALGWPSRIFPYLCGYQWKVLPSFHRVMWVWIVQ